MPVPLPKQEIANHPCGNSRARRSSRDFDEISSWLQQSQTNHQPEQEASLVSVLKVPNDQKVHPADQPPVQQKSADDPQSAEIHKKFKYLTGANTRAIVKFDTGKIMNHSSTATGHRLIWPQCSRDQGHEHR